MSTRCFYSFIGLILLLSANVASAQVFQGYQTSQFAGVHGIPLNPASAAGYHGRWDINIIGAGLIAGNTYASFSKKALLSNQSTLYRNVDYFLDSMATRNQYAWAEAEIMMPSVLYAIDKYQSFAFTWRIRGSGNINNVSTPTANMFANNYPNVTYLDRTINEPYAQGGQHGWNEFGFTYARLVKEDIYSRLKLGATVKLLSGIISGYGSGENATYVFKSDGTLDIKRGIAQFSYNKENDEGHETIGDYFGFFNHASLGLDLGLIYDILEGEDGYGAYEDADIYFNPGADQYKLRLGISITDIGRLKYDASVVSQKVDLTSENLSANGLTRRRGESEQEYLLRLGSYFEQQEFPSTYTMTLPTALHLSADYKIREGFYLGAVADIGLTGGKKLDRKTNKLVQLAITPRYDKRWWGVYTPLVLNRFGQADAGLVLRAGPLVLGSASLFTSLAKKNLNRVDGFVVLRVIPIKFASRNRGNGIFRSKKGQVGCPVF